MCRQQHTRQQKPFIYRIGLPPFNRGKFAVKHTFVIFILWNYTRTRLLWMCNVQSKHALWKPLRIMDIFCWNAFNSVEYFLCFTFVSIKCILCVAYRHNIISRFEGRRRGMATSVIAKRPNYIQYIDTGVEILHWHWHNKNGIQKRRKVCIWWTSRHRLPICKWRMCLIWIYEQRWSCCWVVRVDGRCTSPWPVIPKSSLCIQ